MFIWTTTLCSFRLFIFSVCSLAAVYARSLTRSLARSFGLFVWSFEWMLLLFFLFFHFISCAVVVFFFFLLHHTGKLCYICNVHNLMYRANREEWIAHTHTNCIGKCCFCYDQLIATLDGVNRFMRRCCRRGRCPRTCICEHIKRAKKGSKQFYLIGILLRKISKLTEIFETLWLTKCAAVRKKNHIRYAWHLNCIGHLCFTHSHTHDSEHGFFLFLVERS